MKKLRIATRKSPLAWQQAEIIKTALIAQYPDLKIDLIGYTTQADKFLDQPLQTLGGKGLFVKELELALMENLADIAVHSIKDLPGELPAPLELAVICQREDARDVFISERFANLASLPPRSRIGTSSLRRQCQLQFLRPDLELLNLRGNVGSRLQKLKAGQFDAIILAAAGLKRLQLTDQIRQYFTLTEMIPAIGQGALGIECRREDSETKKLISFLDHPNSRHCILAERAMNAEFGGNCQIPIGAYADIQSGKLQIMGIVGGQTPQPVILRSQIEGEPATAELLGKQLAQDLIRQGAWDILKTAKP